MKVLRIPVWWTPQEADSILLFLDELKNVIGHAYAEEIQHMYRTIQQQQKKETDELFDVGPPF